MDDVAHFDLTELQKVSGGEIIGDLSCALSKRWSISTDTRCDNHGKIFFALAGETFDAHNFLTQAADSGAELLCIKRSKCDLLPTGAAALLVDDPLKTLQALAAYHRQRFSSLKIAAVTGSVGKTSVKEMLRAIFVQSCNGNQDEVLYTVGNTNNHLGVPQNLLRLTSQHRFAVIEMGTSSPGEIEPLTLITRPDAAVVNTIAPCHLENLIDLNGVATEKSTIFNGLPADGIAVIPTDSPSNEILQKASKNFRSFTFGTLDNGKVNSGVSAKFAGGTLFDSHVELHFPNGQVQEFSWSLAGNHQAANAAAAATIAFAMGIAPEVIAQGLSKTELPGMRMKKSIISGVTYINDAYNANPASMRAMIQLLAGAKPGEWRELFLVLGGMRELGAGSAAEHKTLLDYAVKMLPNAKIITVGAEFNGFDMVTAHFTNSADAADTIAAAVKAGDYVVAKGSRGNRTELALPPEAR